MPGDGAFVHDRLSVVLAVRLQLGNVEEAVGGAEETEAVRLHDLFERGVVDGDDGVLHEAGVPETHRARHVLEVVPVERPGDTLAPQRLVVPQHRRDAPVAVHVAEVKLPPGFQQPEASFEHRLLVGAQIDDAVRHDHVDAPRREVQLLQPLDEPRRERGVRRRVAEGGGVVRLVLPRHVQLARVRHVHADHTPLRAHELRRDVDVAPGAAPQVQDGETVQNVRDGQTTAVILSEDVGVNLL
mmetsp:Transcript_49982/g.97820  ORF Transcript_49982/g.97820 Transcript_49982/m.97820 type:complete len:242 (+) Transcript_49982:592-1317(+)